MRRLATFAAAALAATLVAAPVHAENCQTFYNPTLPGTGDAYKCYQRFVWHQQQGSWCERDWYLSCMHAGWHEETGGNNSPHDWKDEDGNSIAGNSSNNGWVTGYSEHDDGRVAPRNIYVSAGTIIVYPYVCRNSLKTSPDDPGRRIESNDARAMQLFPNPTLSEIRRYITSGACGDCPGAGNQAGTGC